MSKRGKVVQYSYMGLLLQCTTTGDYKKGPSHDFFFLSPRYISLQYGPNTTGKYTAAPEGYSSRLAPCTLESSGKIPAYLPETEFLPRTLHHCDSPIPMSKGHDRALVKIGYLQKTVDGH